MLEASDVYNIQDCDLTDVDNYHVIESSNHSDAESVADATWDLHIYSYII